MDAFKTLLIVDTIRGPHSTGVAGINNNGDWDIIKKKGNAWDLFDCKDYTKVASSAKYALLGHNRYATKGKINNINAHPFEFEHVVGMHNGTIRGQHRLIDHTQFEVDSENIYHSINKIGLEDTLKVLDGAYALVYWDKRTEELVMVRNSERPLYYTYSEDNKTVYWASEQWMLYVSISRAGLKHNDVIEVKPCTIYRFNIDMRYNGDPITTAVQQYKEYTPPALPAAQYNRGYSKPSGAVNPPAKKEEVPLKSQELQRMIGKVVEFTPLGHKKNPNLQWYIQGEMKDYPGVEVKVYATANSKQWNDLTVNYDAVFQGEIGSYAQYGSTCYVTIRPSSVIQIIEDDFEDDLEAWGVYLGFGNKVLVEEDWLAATKKGCEWCGQLAGQEDACNIEWLSETTHICAGCQETERWEAHRKEA